MITEFNITLKKSFDLNHHKPDDDKIIQILFDEFLDSDPRRAKILPPDTILIRNYLITNEENTWHKQSSIILNTNPWSSIKKAKITLVTDPVTNSKTVIYKIDFFLTLLKFVIMIGTITVAFGFGLINNYLSLHNATMMFSIISGIFIFVFSVGTIIQISEHKIILNNAINKVKWFREG